MSELAKKVAGTFVADSRDSLSPVLRWLTDQCRDGGLAGHVRQFCAEQPEILSPEQVLAESVTDDCIHCRIPCKCSDHESAGAFDFDVRFELDPCQGGCRRN